MFDQKHQRGHLTDREIQTENKGKNRDKRQGERYKKRQTDRAKYRERQTNREREREMERQRERRKQRQRPKEIYIEREIDIGRDNYRQSNNRQTDMQTYRVS